MTGKNGKSSAVGTRTVCHIVEGAPKLSEANSALRWQHIRALFDVSDDIWAREVAPRLNARQNALNKLDYCLPMFVVKAKNCFL